jgi:excinuclease UvrABC ATPase subunit
MIERELCDHCGGNGVVKIHHGVSVCPACHGSCYSEMLSVALEQQHALLAQLAKLEAQLAAARAEMRRYIRAVVEE